MSNKTLQINLPFHHSISTGCSLTCKHQPKQKTKFFWWVLLDFFSFILCYPIGHTFLFTFFIVGFESLHPIGSDIILSSFPPTFTYWSHPPRSCHVEWSESLRAISTNNQATATDPVRTFLLGVEFLLGSDFLLLEVTFQLFSLFSSTFISSCLQSLLQNGVLPLKNIKIKILITTWQIKLHVSKNRRIDILNFSN